MLPEKIKDFGLSSCMSLMWVEAFVVCKFLPLLIETMTFHGAMFMFAGGSLDQVEYCEIIKLRLFTGFCLVGFAFVYLFVPETKGLFINSSLCFTFTQFIIDYRQKLRGNNAIAWLIIEWSVPMLEWKKNLKFSSKSLVPELIFYLYGNRWNRSKNPTRVLVHLRNVWYRFRSFNRLLIVF